MRKIYVLYAHPEVIRSRLNVAKRAAIEGLEGVTINDLYHSYPDQFIDVEAERARVEAADVLVMQFPLYWYAPPAILKVWQDDMLEHGWAFGSNATALKGKGFLISTSMGEPEEGYAPGKKHGHSIDTFLAPLVQTAVYCGMAPLTPHCEFGTARYSDLDRRQAAEAYRDKIVTLRDDQQELAN